MTIFKSRQQLIAENPSTNSQTTVHLERQNSTSRIRRGGSRILRMLSGRASTLKILFY